MNKSIELIKQYPPWRKNQIGLIKCGLSLFLLGLIATILITYVLIQYMLEVSVLPAIQTFICGLAVWAIVCALPLMTFVIGFDMLFGTLAESISDSYTLWKYNRSRGD